jgi:hypothetical protein
MAPENSVHSAFLVFSRMGEPRTIAAEEDVGSNRYRGHEEQQSQHALRWLAVLRFSTTQGPHEIMSLLR